MITADVRDWIADKDLDLTQVINGPLFNTKREKLMSVERAVTVAQPRAIVGESSYSRIACNCILHFDKSYRSTERKAKEIHDILLSQDHELIDGHEIVLLQIRNFVPLGMDENDIYEFAIDFEIIYKRQKRLESENE